jgi:copper chaperone CopZ
MFIIIIFRAAVAKVAGVQAVEEVSRVKGCVRVRGTMNPHAVVATIERTGYPASLTPFQAPSTYSARGEGPNDGLRQPLLEVVVGGEMSTYDSPPPSGHVSMTISGMTCASCSSKVQTNNINNFCIFCKYNCRVCNTVFTVIIVIVFVVPGVVRNLKPNPLPSLRWRTGANPSAQDAARADRRGQPLG